MNLHRLRLLQHLQALGTVTATAETLGLTVPAVSQQLAVLEREAGVALFERSGRTLRLTSAGETLAQHADVVLTSVAAAEAALAGLRDGASGNVRIAAFPSAARALLPDLWLAVRGGGADVGAGGIEQRRSSAGSVFELSFTDAEPEAALAALGRNAVDVAIVHSYSLVPLELPPGCEGRVLLEDPVLLALPTQLADQLGVADEPIELGSLAGATWVAPATDHSCHEMLRRACGAVGFVPDVVATSADFSVLAALVGAGAGAALIPRLALPESIPDGVLLRQLAAPVHRSVLTVTRRGAAERPDVRTVLAELERTASRSGRSEGVRAGGARARTPR